MQPPHPPQPLSVADEPGNTHSGSAPLAEIMGLRRPDVFTLHLGAAMDAAWAEHLDGVEILSRADGSSMLTAYTPDQASLFGLVLRIRDLGVPLLGLYPASALPRRDP
jgi:hypothetical protein